MRLGAHISTAGGLHTAFQRGHEAGCDSMLIFTKSNRQWAAKPLTAQDVALYRQTCAEYGQIGPTAVHASYLINVASPDEALWEKSYQALKVEVERCGELGIPLLTFHPGSYMTGDEATGLANIARALRRLLAETDSTAPDVTICLETMAGQGSNLGGRFEQLAYLLREAGCIRASAFASIPVTSLPLATTSARRQPMPPPWLNSTASWGWNGLSAST
jgi:deoxyribonuclease IV